MGMNHKSILILVLIFNAFSFNSWAVAKSSVAIKQRSDQWLNKDGAVRGGVASGYMSLFDVRKSASAKLKTERLVLDWGDAYGRPSPKSGYYQVEYQAQMHRVIINLALTLNSKVDGRALTDRLSKGLYIKTARLEFDSMGQAQNLVLDLKKTVRVRVASYPSQMPQGNIQRNIPARLVVDLVE